MNYFSRKRTPEIIILRGRANPELDTKVAAKSIRSSSSEARNPSLA
jgi:hypothetical protein